MHHVRKGETLDGIARHELARHGKRHRALDVERYSRQIAATNHLPADGRKLKAGSDIAIPALDHRRWSHPHHRRLHAEERSSRHEHHKHKHEHTVTHAHDKGDRHGAAHHRAGHEHHGHLRHHQSGHRESHRPQAHSHRRAIPREPVGPQEQQPVLPGPWQPDQPPEPGSRVQPAAPEQQYPPAPSPDVRPQNQTAIYDISAHTIYLPNGERLEAHSGLGPMRDDPRYVSAKNRGPTPPNVYDLSMRRGSFHGVQAIRLNPEPGSRMYGRDGILAHTYMLGPSGQSNGCLAIRNYSEFLRAYQSGEINRLVVVPHLS